MKKKYSLFLLGFFLASTSTVCAHGNDERDEAATPGLVPQLAAIPAATPRTPAAPTRAPESPLEDVTKRRRSEENTLNNTRRPLNPMTQE